jgi:UDP:flavonoid glycosyltransferase YjiC (YdhE family)
MGETPLPVPPRPGGRRRRVLFIAEAVTLAHVARPLVLAQALPTADYDVVFATDPRFRPLYGESPFEVRQIRSISTERFLDALAKGDPIYDVATIRDYVRDDLSLLSETSPDLVVGDFRLSLAISARIAGVPYFTITNAYWSPYSRRSFPMPEIPLTRRLGIPLSRWVFRAVRPLAFAYHTISVNRIRREYGLPSLGLDLRRVYTEADNTLYADIPELVPTHDLPPNHHYLGAILWSPTIEPPPWWSDIPRDRPTIYVNLGSSGRRELLPQVLSALSQLPVTVLAATLGRTDLDQKTANLLTWDYLPGQDAAARADLVICNGGSPAVHQSLAAGKPVLGVAGNMDQHLNMEGVRRVGAGILLRSEYAHPHRIRGVVAGMLEDATLSKNALEMAKKLAEYDAAERFTSMIRDHFH